MAIPRLDAQRAHLADVVPSVLAAMEVDGFTATLPFPTPVNGACVLLIDGLGAELLDTHAADAPVMAGLNRRTIGVGFPSTTVAGLAAIGTGMCSGQHGMVGYTFRVPDAGVINALRWRRHPSGGDLRDSLSPNVVQPLPTTFERAAADIAVSVVSRDDLDSSPLTRAVLRGARYVGVHALGDLAFRIGDAIAAGGLCFGYHGDLDMIGHLHGPGSHAWRMQLRQVDRLVESIVEHLPSGGLLGVVADHGMITVDPAQMVDIDASAALMDGAVAIGGEARARHVYVDDGATAEVLDAWRETLGARAWVITRDEAIDAGWFGPGVTDRVRPRIGDVVAAARGSAVMVRRSAEPVESRLVGHHGSLTAAEQLVPLLMAVG